jgi:hypothetical protein
VRRDIERLAHAEAIVESTVCSRSSGASGNAVTGRKLQATVNACLARVT